MKQAFTTNRPLKWMAPMLLATVFFAACNNDAAKTEATPSDSGTSKMAPADSTPSKMPTSLDTGKKMIADSLPPIDTSVSHRPETRKANK